MSNNSNFYAFHPRGAIKMEEEAASVSKKQKCLHHEVTYFLLNKISRGYDSQLGCVLRYYTMLWRHPQHFNKQIHKNDTSDTTIGDYLLLLLLLSYIFIF